MTYGDRERAPDPWSLPPSGRPASPQDDCPGLPFWPLPALLLMAILPFGLLTALIRGDLGPALFVPVMIMTMCLGAMLPVTAGGSIVYGVILLAVRIVAAIARRSDDRRA
jgi:hypothetical protein